MRKLTVAACQMACGTDIGGNIARADALVAKAAKAGANVVLLQELFETPYFCQQEKAEYFALATELGGNRAVAHFSAVAKKLGVVIPVSFFERKNRAHYNTVAVIDADGSVLGTYRKSHIPDGPGYEEKFYFNPGDTGVRVWDTRFGRIGIGICWDQWYPELARCMVLKGAEILLYPTAIGSEPQDSSLDSMEHWRLTMRGHAAANLTPVVASNRIGREAAGNSGITFYGSSFIAGCHGELVAEADRTSETVIQAEFDLDAISATRAAWGIFRDRRPDLYGAILTYDGERTLPHGS
jgi:N-carbamoylputrescine amidase